MRRKFATFTLLSLYAVAAQAEDWSKVTFVPSVGTSYKSLEFEKVLDESVVFGMFNASGTVAVGPMHFTVSGETSMTDSDAQLQNNSGEVSRTEIGFAAGYNVWRSLTIFTGYLNGETRASFVSPAGRVTYQGVAAYKGAEQLDYDYSEWGYYFGASYGFNFNAKGSLNASIAYAILNGGYASVEDVSPRYSSPSMEEDDLVSPDSSTRYNSSCAEGETTGVSLGVRWTAPISSKLAYSVGSKLKMFNFQQTGRCAGTTFDGDQVGRADNVDEVFFELGAGLSYFF